MALRDRFVQSGPPLGCLLISSPQGHSGKTIIAVGLCAALKRRGLSIQPFKKGPDYIDPSWLTAAAGRSCRNLDTFLIPEERLIQMFQQTCQGTDLAVVEGAMGLYDGMESVENGTTAEIARLLDIPILLAVNTTRMTGSIAAMVAGYQHFQPGIKIAGVILNFVSGSRHEQKLRNAVEQYCGIPVVGSVPRDQALRIDERHLGLIPSLESGKAETLIESIGSKMESYLDLEKILVIARKFEMPYPSVVPPEERDRVVPNRQVRTKIGVIRDRAFNFYYQENLDALEEAGAEIIFVNSLKDGFPEVDGLYIGGGFPEFFLEELEGNRELRRAIGKAIEEGLPAYVECAGLMYLCRSIRWQDRSYEMVGIIPADVELSQRPEGHGYAIAKVITENYLFPEGLTVRGHEFHHSKLSPVGESRFAYQIIRGHGITGRNDGILYKNLFASYLHLHALGTPEWAEGFVALAGKERRIQGVALADGKSGFNVLK
jgi:cobyrinic acid a,c-diamide synthase